MNDYAARIACLQSVMHRRGASLTVISWTDQMRYLTGYVEGAHERLLALFVPAEGEAAFLVPSMNAQAARTNPAGIERVIGWMDAEGWVPAAQRLFEEFGVGSDPVTAILIDDELHSVHLLALQGLAPTATYQPAGEALAELRGHKTAHELACLDTAAQWIDAIFEETLGQLKVGVTELDIQEFVLNAIKRRGSTPSFNPLICFGTNGAMPHHGTDSTPLKVGDLVIIDIGCTCEHYCSDITRTVAFGEPSDPEAKAVYKIVNAAHHAAREVVAPGITCEAVDTAARRVIDAARYGKQFIHRTGHGIGLSCHEPPNINTGSHTALEPGMCFSVEPGIYLPGRFGVRIENIVTVTEQGVRSLNTDAATELRIVAP